MLPLSTIEDKETEEVQTKPPEKGGETHVGRGSCRRAGVGGSEASDEEGDLETGPVPTQVSPRGSSWGGGP